MVGFHLLVIVVVAAVISCSSSLLIIYSQGWHGKHSLDHDLSGAQKFHATAVPRIGGIAVVTSVVLAIFLCLLLFPGLFPSQYVSPAGKLLLASLPAFMAGIVEDLTKKVSVKVRLCSTIVSALIASWLLGATVDAFDLWGVDSLLLVAPVALAVTVIGVAGGANAINIIDGFNGLAGSVVIIMLASLGFIAWQVGDGLLTDLALLGCGAALGFLFVNFPTGRLFLGDGGAYFLGFWAAEIAVLLLARNASVNTWQVSSVCAYPVIEVLYSIYRRKVISKASPGAPDGLHLHTLLYRCVAPRLVPGPGGAAWKLNAAVTCIVAPCIGVLALATVFIGKTIPGSMLILFLQIFLYLMAYRWLIRRDTLRSPATELRPRPGANVELS
ncbi:UDP-N-acetylmuramyl pentapeptide phosphotransferase/UDP-N-acetylglucosamine-1-phosphate transferase [Oxalobacteraceae bacterium GrIS 1.11]